MPYSSPSPSFTDSKNSLIPYQKNVTQSSLYSSSLSKHAYHPYLPHNRRNGQARLLHHLRPPLVLNLRSENPRLRPGSIFPSLTGPPIPRRYFIPRNLLISPLSHARRPELRCRLPKHRTRALHPWNRAPARSKRHLSRQASRRATNHLFQRPENRPA